MPAGLGGGGALGFAFETTYGTFVPPTIWIPIISEEFRYTEERYFSPQLRQQVMVSDVKQGYYHIEGDIVMEVDPNFFPYFMYISRHTTTKTGTAPSLVYKSVPNKQATFGTPSKSASITILRNDIIFGYTGCLCGQYEFTVEDGVLRCTLSMLGLADSAPAGPFTPTWLTPDLYGADAHAIFVASTFGPSPTFGTASRDFNGITITMNHNAAAQNRIVKDRGASYIAYGETEISFNTELDFVDKTEYTNFVNTTQRGIKLESTQGANPFATATDGVKIQLNRFAYESYDVSLPGMGDLIMAGATGRGLAVAGGDAYEIHCKSPADIV
jgi:hypothetical protein